MGRAFRKAFVPADGYELLVADYNQIELRCIAHLAEDPGLIEAFESGTDIHTETAAAGLRRRPTTRSSSTSGRRRRWSPTASPTAWRPTGSASGSASPPTEAPGDPRRLLRRLPVGARLHGPDRRRGPGAGLHRDPVRPPPPDPRAVVQQLPHPPGGRAPGHERRHPGPGRRHLQGGAGAPRPGARRAAGSTAASSCRCTTRSSSRSRRASATTSPRSSLEAMSGAVRPPGAARGQPRRSATQLGRGQGRERPTSPARSGPRSTTGSDADHCGEPTCGTRSPRAPSRRSTFLSTRSASARRSGARCRAAARAATPIALGHGGASRSVGVDIAERFVDLARRRRPAGGPALRAHRRPRPRRSTTSSTPSSRCARARFGSSAAGRRRSTPALAGPGRGGARRDTGSAGLAVTAVLGRTSQVALASARATGDGLRRRRGRQPGADRRLRAAGTPSRPRTSSFTTWTLRLLHAPATCWPRCSPTPCAPPPAARLRGRRGTSGR